MKIQKIRFKNLNSLVGEWEIDLSHAAFVNEGIFAITGPTGAGKSTILDAICLALFGRTPRLGRIVKSENELMSRRTAECFSEVTFSTFSGVYRCHWSQHRAGKKTSGALQNAKHELSLAENGQILASKTQEVNSRLIDVTGLDYDQFTRSVLLAQGGFAAFLQATPEERSPILEQITGTEIYSQISMKVHERFSQERKILDELTERLKLVPVLTLEEERQLQSASLEVQTTIETLKTEIAFQDGIIQCLGNITRYKLELQQTTMTLAECQQSLLEFEPLKHKLVLSIKALELAASHSNIERERQALSESQSKIGEFSKLSLLTKVTMDLAHTKYMNDSEILNCCRLDKQKWLPILTKVKELDLRIVDRQSKITAVQNECLNLTQNQMVLTDVIGKILNEIGDLETLQKQLLSLLENSDADKVLVESMSGIQRQIDSLNSEQTGLQNLKNRIGQQTQLHKDAGKQLETELGYFATKQETFLSLEIELQSKKKQLKDLLQQASISEWKQNCLRIEENKHCVENLISARQNVIKIDGEIRELNEKTAAHHLAAETLKSETLHSKLQILEFEKQEEGLLQKASLALEIRDLEEERRTLRNGEPCPLCGSLEHPFNHEILEGINETSLKLSIVRVRRMDEHTSLQNKIIALTRLESDIANGVKEKETLCAQMQGFENRIQELAKTLKLDIADINFDSEIVKREQQYREAFENISKTLELSSGLEKVLLTLNLEHERVSQEVSAINEKVTLSSQGLNSLAEDIRRLSETSALQQEKHDASFRELALELETFGFVNLSPNNLTPVLLDLKLRRDAWSARVAEKSQCDHALELLHLKKIQYHEKLQNTLEAQRQAHKTRLELQVETETAIKERLMLLENEDISATDFENQLEFRLSEAEKALEDSRDKFQVQKQSFEQLLERIGELEQDIHVRKVKLEEIEVHFRSSLLTKGFDNEEALKAALLEDTERLEIANREKALYAGEASLKETICKLQLNLETEEHRVVGSETLEVLLIRKQNLETDMGLKQQELGALNQKQLLNSLAKESQVEKKKTLELQSRNFSKWDALQMLIGSKDGKKYQKFAQGLTFQIMIAHANRQLEKMNDRYQLVQALEDNAPSLELNVVDAYQAGEERSTKTLSGGESFVMSLALALGLSQMASKKIRVDSLFMDEGFGTLDEDALDTALDMLSNLNRQGKMIGIISHVASLKQRVGVQIQVVPINGGKSRVEGPGCRYLGK